MRIYFTESSFEPATDALGTPMNILVHAKVPELRKFIKSKYALHSLNESYIRIYGMHLYIQAASVQ